MKNTVQMKWGIKTYAFLGMMIALVIVLARFLSISIGPGIRLSTGSVCSILTGLWLGPVAGALVGGIADVVGMMINPSGAWLPLITLSAACWGMIPGLLRGMIKGDKTRRILMTALVVLITSTVCQLGLTTIALVTAFGKGLLPGRLMQYAGSTPVYCILVTALYESPLTGMIRSAFLEAPSSVEGPSSEDDETQVSPSPDVSPHARDKNSMSVSEEEK